MQQGIEELGDLEINIILSKLDPKDTARVACVNKRFNSWASDDSLWSLHCSNDLSLTSPLDPSGNPLPSFKVTYQLWRESFRTYPWPLLKRVKSCWDRLKSWLERNFPEVLENLQKGISEEDLNEAESSLKLKLPLPTRLIYRLHDGQQYEDSDGLLGLIGGYSMHEHLVNVNLLPLKDAILGTKRAIRNLGFSSMSGYMVVAASVTQRQKFFFMNCNNMQLYVGTGNFGEDGERRYCVPEGMLKPSGDQQCDGLLLWLEEHVQRLETGMIKVREENNLKFICQIPERSPLCSFAVTNGVQVRASAVIVPERCYLRQLVLSFAYSIRMSLLPPGCNVNGITFNSCQLQWRHRIIREYDTIRYDVNGEGVIGKYPLLKPGVKEFFYQRFIDQLTSSGSIEGSFKFVPGSLAEPKGDSFEVEAVSSSLVMPEYIF